MLIPNKFSGYQQDGRRTYPAGGGVGEAMLLGAAMGGGSAAITGGDPLKGALLGGITGGIGGGISSTVPEQAVTQAVGEAPLRGAFPTAAQGATGAGGTFTEGMQKFINSPLASIKGSPWIAGAAGLAGAQGARIKPDMPGTDEDDEYYRKLFNWKTFRPSAPSLPRMYAAQGGIASLAAGGYDKMVGEQPQYAQQMARGGISNLGTYSDGGRMLRGPGDGMSDSIPGVIAGKRPARLADGEFVVPADVVSHLGNGSTDAGARQLYAMMNKVRRARTGRKQQGREINPRKFMPA